MAWHIFKKDLRLLWVMALIVASTQFAAEALHTWIDLSTQRAQLTWSANLLSLVSIIGLMVLAVAVVHQDPVPGLRQDWLIRPIRRRDVILAKLLFLLVVVQGPVLVADMGGGLAHGFALAPVIEASLERNLAILCRFTLPAAAIAVVSRNLTESIALTMGSFVAYVVVFRFGLPHLFGIIPDLGAIGASWIAEATWYSLALFGVPAVIALQYLRRKTALARAFIGLGVALVLLSAWVPWRLAFALQEQVISAPDSAKNITFTFDPQLGRFTPPAHAAEPIGAILYLPLRVKGLPPSSLVLLDRATVRIRNESGRTIYDGQSNLTVDGFGSIKDARFEVSRDRGNEDPALLYQRIFLKPGITAIIGSRRVNLTVAYSLTLFKAGPAYSLPALAGRAALDRIGICRTSVDGEGNDVQLRCVGTRAPPSCFTAYLQYVPSGLRNPPIHRCVPNYTPPPFGQFWPDSLSRYGGELPFFDRSGLNRYPIDGSKLASSRFVLKTYAPRDHFTRRLQISGIRLSDFISGAASRGTAL